MLGNLREKYDWIRLTPSPAMLGFRAEVFAAEWLADECPAWSFEHVGTGGGCDIIATHKLTGKIKRIEVKISRRGADGKYRATLEKTGATSVSEHADIVLFFCLPPVGAAVPFILPLKAFKPGQRALCVTSHPETYTGKYSAGRSNLGVFQNA